LRKSKTFLNSQHKPIDIDSQIVYNGILKSKKAYGIDKILYIS